MLTQFPEHIAHVTRYLWEKPGLVVVMGTMAALGAGRRAYAGRYPLETDDDRHAVLLDRMLAAAGLAAVALPERESWGWSLALPGLPAGVFCGVEPEGMLCCRLVASEPDATAAVVQRQKAGHPMTQSHFSLESTDPVQAVIRYFSQAHQTRVRLAVAGDGRGVLVQPLPGGDLSVVAGSGDAGLLDLLGRPERMQLLEEVLLFYACRCTEEMILSMLTALPEADRLQLWQGSSQLRISCPRCGRTYTIARN